MLSSDRFPSSRRRFLRLGLVLTGAGLLQGCLRPLLAKDSSSTALLGRIQLPEIDGRVGFFLHQSLEDRLGREVANDWRLAVNVNLTERGLAVAQDNAVTRISVTATADWALYAEGKDKPVLMDRTTTQSGYNSTDALFATRQTRLDIERRLARDLGERISRTILAQANRITTSG